MAGFDIYSRDFSAQIGGDGQTTQASQGSEYGFSVLKLRSVARRPSSCSGQAFWDTIDPRIVQAMHLMMFTQTVETWPPKQGVHQLYRAVLSRSEQKYFTFVESFPSIAKQNRLTLHPQCAFRSHDHASHGATRVFSSKTSCQSLIDSAHFMLSCRGRSLYPQHGTNHNP